MTCDECDYDGNIQSSDELIGALRKIAATFATALAAADAATLRQRPAPNVWSALEYTAHTRDALAWYAARIDLVLTQDRPQLTAFDWDAACEQRRYVEEDPADTVAGVSSAADGLATTLNGLSAQDWARRGIGSDGGDRTVLALARRAVHEGVHHLFDVRRVLQTVMARSR